MRIEWLRVRRTGAHTYRRTIDTCYYDDGGGDGEEEDESPCIRNTEHNAFAVRIEESQRVYPWNRSAGTRPTLMPWGKYWLVWVLGLGLERGDKERNAPPPAQGAATSEPSAQCPVPRVPSPSGLPNLAKWVHLLGHLSRPSSQASVVNSNPSWGA